jgi:hypothetical protein
MAVRSAKQFTVGAKPSQPERVIFGFSVNQQQIWFHVALAVTGPITAQIVIAES